MSITEFLTARYDEEEAAVHKWWTALDRDEKGVPAWIINAGGLVHPVRALADIAAKRRIVELCATWIAEGERQVSGRDALSIAARTQAITADTVLRALAHPYAEHPDYDPEWRVG